MKDVRPPALDVKKTVYADFGNSRLKLLVDSNSSAFEYSNPHFLNDIDDYLSVIAEEPAICYSSVNDKKLNELKNFLTGSEARFVEARKFVDRSELIDLSRVKGVGSDRIFGVLGALSRGEPPLITVDCGTATTVNVLDDNSVFLGGAIFAGARLQIKSLSKNTELLPEFDFFSTSETVGANTKTAIAVGSSVSVAGGIDLLIERIEREFFEGRQVPVYFTGGFSEIVLAELARRERKKIHDPVLVLHGIKYICERFFDK